MQQPGSRGSFMDEMGLETKFVMPAWWTKAFEASSLVEAKATNAFELSSSMGIIPALNRPELDALASLIHRAQIQILSGSKNVSVKLSEHVKSSPYIKLGQQFAFERILQLISATHLASQGESGTVKTCPLFKGFQIQAIQSTDDWSIELHMDHQTRELILAYLDPYAELLRKSQDQPLLHDFIGEKNPLKLWKPVWLELQGNEQSIFLRMEKALQWQNQLMRLDGVYGESLDELLDGIQRKTRKSAELQLESYIKLLRSLGKKLIEHGVLTDSKDFDYCHVAESFNSSLLSWQLSSHYLASLADGNYERAVASNFNQNRNWSRLCHFFSEITHLSSDKREKIQKWIHLKSTTQANQESYLIKNGQLTNCLPIFVEFFIRTQAPLAEAVSSHAAIEIITRSHSEIDSSYESYLEYLRQSGNIKLSEMFEHSLANPENWSQIQISESRVETPTIQKATAKKKEPKTYLNKQQATEALMDLRNHKKAIYDQIKDAYLKSLEPDKIRIIMEVKQRLSPSVFDDHLKQSLVKFMLEHPELWQEAQ